MIVLCPLEYERRALRRTARLHGFQLACTGPGDGAARWLREHDLKKGEAVVLAGLAAGLASHAVAASAWQAGAVLSGDEIWRPTLLAPSLPSATLACVPEVLRTAAEKRRTAAETGAILADMESAPFAREASRAGLAWAVVRGVSDPVHQELPGEVTGWTSASGRTRMAAVARDLIRSPHLVPALFRTGRTASAAMRGVARALATMSHAAYNTQPAQPAGA